MYLIIYTIMEASNHDDDDNLFENIHKIQQIVHSQLGDSSLDCK